MRVLGKPWLLRRFNKQKKKKIMMKLIMRTTNLPD